MALRILHTHEMIALTRSWVDPSHRDHQILAAHPPLAALLPRFTAIHDELVRMQPVAEKVQRLSELRGAQEEVDSRHDALLRGISLCLRGAAHLARSPEQAEALEELHRLLLPGGLQMINASYRQQIGHAEVVAASLTRAHEALLRAIVTPDRNLYQAVQAWLAECNELGRLDHERRGVEADVGGLGRSDNGRIRGRWIRMVALLRQAAEFIDGGEEVAELLARIEQAELEADRRRAQRIARAASSDGSEPGSGDELESGLATGGAIDGSGSVDGAGDVRAGAELDAGAVPDAVPASDAGAVPDAVPASESGVEGERDTAGSEAGRRVVAQG